MRYDSGMARKVHLEPHLSAAELEQRYRGTSDPVERSHFHIIWLISKGRTKLQVSEDTAYSTRWIRELVSRYNQFGPEGLGDQRHQNAGAAPLLTPEQEIELKEALRAPPSDGGVWSGPKVAAWIAKKIGVEKVHPQRGWDYLKRVGYSIRRPRPKHTKSATSQKQSEFKKNS